MFGGAGQTITGLCEQDWGGKGHFAPLLAPGGVGGFESLAWLIEALTQGGGPLINEAPVGF